MFEQDLNKMIDSIVDSMFKDPTLDWDKKSYNFNRDEKDMHPYSMKTSEKECIITHNILGINKEDIKLTKEIENGKSYISIQGKTKDSVTGKEYSVNSRFALDINQLDLSKITANAKNGLLYIIIPRKKENKKESKNIEIISL